MKIKFISLLFVSLATVIGFAAEPALAVATVTINPNNKTLKVNETVALTVTINPNGARVGAAEINFAYDVSQLEFVSFTPVAYSTCVPGSDTPGKITRNCAVLEGTTQTSNFGVITLKALKTSEAKLTVSGQVLDANNQNQFNSAVSAALRIENSPPVSQPVGNVGQVKAASTSATPAAASLTASAQPTITVTFGNRDETNSKVQGSSQINFWLIGLALALGIYILYLRGFFKRFSRSR